MWRRGLWRQSITQTLLILLRRFDKVGSQGTAKVDSSWKQLRFLKQNVAIGAMLTVTEDYLKEESSFSPSYYLPTSLYFLLSAGPSKKPVGKEYERYIAESQRQQHSIQGGIWSWETTGKGLLMPGFFFNTWPNVAFVLNIIF